MDVLYQITSMVLMMVLYSARYARPDLCRAIGRLARYITKWSTGCDRRPKLLMDHVKSTLEYRHIAYIGDPLECAFPGLWRDAALARIRPSVNDAELEAAVAAVRR